MRFIKKHSFEIFCILPLVLFLLVFTFVPILRIIFLSFQSSPSSALSLVHYRDLIFQQEFRSAFLNTIIIAVGSLIIELGLGLIMALLLSCRLAGRKIITTFFMLPLAIPTVVVGVMMSYMFSTSGWINRILMDFSLNDSGIRWMGGGLPSLTMVMVADAWKVTPLVMLILLAGLKSIDPELYNAAYVDGANSLGVFRRITLPLLLPYITAAVIIRGVDAFRIFELPLILMGQNLKVVGTYAYLEYVEYNNVHLSAASAVILFAMIMCAVALYIKMVGKKGLQSI